MLASPQLLQAFVPRALRELLIRDTAPLTPVFNGALLFADISGFSKLALNFAAQGGEGAEALTNLINAYFEQLIHTLHAHGGDVVAFAGDAVLVLFRSHDLQDAVWRGTYCARQVANSLADYEIAPGIRLSMRVSLGAGDMRLVLLGSSQQQQVMVLGPPLQQIRLADQAASPGDVVVAPAAFALLPEGVTAQPLGQAGNRVLYLPTPEEQLPAAVDPLADEKPELLRKYIPQAVLSRLDAGQTEWLAELRRVAIAFVRLDEIDAATLESADKLEFIAEAIQLIVERYDGTVVHFLADDKGTIAMLGFGIPPHNPEKLAFRAMQATQAVMSILTKSGMSCSIGVATGDVFCGPVGSLTRRCFTVLGEVVNLAARLMQSSRGELLCDKHTRDECSQLPFVRLPNHRIKGYADPVPVFRFRSNRPQTLVDRAQEMRAIESALTDPQAKTLIVEGEPGIGKSELVNQLVVQSAMADNWSILGEASNVERSTPYYIMRGIFETIFGLDRDAMTASRKAAQVRQFTHELPAELSALLPLLNDIIDTDFPESSFITQLTGERRTDNLHILAVAVINRARQVRSLRVIVLDDVQWMDEASWKLTRALIDQVSEVRFVLVTRLMLDSSSAILQNLRQESSTRHVFIAPLSKAGLSGLIRQSLANVELEPELVDFIWTRSEGNPFFAKELTNFLTEADALLIENGVCYLKPQSEVATVIPNSVRDILVGRIEQLCQEAQLTAKTASVIGRIFHFAELEAIYPVTVLRPELPRFLGDLCIHDLVTNVNQVNRSQHADPTTRVHHLQQDDEWNDDLIPLRCDRGSFSFSHLTTQQVAYQQLPVAQRKQLHQAIARWYGLQNEDRSQATIASHLEKAELFQEAAQAYAKAGEFALRQGANQEAIQAFRNALRYGIETAEANQPRRDPIWEAHYRRLLGEAYLHVGAIESSRLELEAALKLLGFPPLQGFLRNASCLVYLLLWHSLKRIRSRKPTRNQLSDEPQFGHVAHTAALANQRLAQIGYFTNEMIVGTTRALRGLQIAESIDDSPTLARSYADLCLVYSLLRHPRLADHFAKIAETVARKLGHLPSLAYVLNITNMHRLAYARFVEVEQLGQESIDIGLQLQCYRDRVESLTVIAMKCCFQGELARGGLLFEQVGSVAELGRNLLHQAWSQCGRGEVLLRTGKTEEAEQCLLAARELLAESRSATEELRAEGLYALCLWRSNRAAEAIKTAIELSQRNFKTPTASALEGISSVMEVLIEAQALQPCNAREVVQACKRMARLFRTYCRVFPIGVPRYQRNLGLWAAVRGRTSKAQAHWRKALYWAQKLDLTTEGDLVRLDLARFSDR